jgi:predicted N-acetyltransferase YhbS
MPDGSRESLSKRDRTMNSTPRFYTGFEDFLSVSDFLIKCFQPGNADGNWLQPTWEYMHTHPYLDEEALSRIGIWEDGGEIIAVAHYEHRLGEAFFEVHPRYAHLKPELLAFAEEHLYGVAEDGSKFLNVYVNDFDTEFSELVSSRGYKRHTKGDRPLSAFSIPSPFPQVVLPEGYLLRSLEEDNDLRKIHRVLWRGFDHSGEPPEEGIEDRKKMQSGPNFRKDLTIVVQAPDGNFASFCGMWYEAANRISYVEPVATDPDYRRMGLGKAAVLEGIRRCGVEGATVVFVGSDMRFYRDIGFRKLFTACCWKRIFP